MSALQKRFHGKSSGFIPFLVAGDPDLKVTADLILALDALEPTAIEVGVPFSDPTADGPVIQRSSQRALSHGTNLENILALLGKTRRHRQVPIVLFGYYNPILQFGIDKFVRALRKAEVAAVLVVDLPFEAAADLQTTLRQNDIDLIFLVAPTTSDRRLKAIARLASGFIYAVSRTGVTGAVQRSIDESRRLVKRIRTVSELPIAVGFGISNGMRARAVCQYADAVVVGSGLVAEIEAASARKSSSHAAVVRRVIRYAQQFLPTTRMASSARAVRPSCRNSCRSAARRRSKNQASPG